MLARDREPARKELHERLFPFRGTWHLPWIIERHLAAGVSGLNATRAANAARALLEMQLGRAHVASLPFVLRLEAINVCNLRCPLCACGTGTDPRPKGMLSLARYRRILANNPQAVIVRLDGMGEPTLSPAMFDMVALAKDARMSTMIHTNFNTPACADPEPFLTSGLDRIVISLDGATQESHSRYRVGGDWALVVERIRALASARRAARLRRPLIEVQTVDFRFNRGEQAALRALSHEIGADRYQVTEAEESTKHGRVRKYPRRCPWLWTVLTVGWDGGYRACSNAWSMPWPRLQMDDLDTRDYWNHPELQEARRFNVRRASAHIAEDDGCKCSRCYEMLAVPLVGSYRNE